MRKKPQQSLSIFLFFALLFLGIALFLNINYTPTENQVQEDLQTKINSFSSELNNNLSELIGIIEKDGLELFYEHAINDFTEEDEHTSFYLYKDHKLIFWTNNQILIPSFDSISSPEVSCLKIGPHWILSQTKSTSQYSLLGIKTLQIDYQIDNEFLDDYLLREYGIKEDIEFSKNRANHEIHSKEGRFLLSFKFKSIPFSINRMPYLLFFSFLFAYLFFSLLIDASLKRLNIIRLSKLEGTVSFGLLTGIFLLTFIFIRFPSSLFQSPLFQPQLYANLSLYSSLGHLFLTSIWLLSLALFYFKNAKLQPLKIKSRILEFGLSFLLLSILAALFYGIYLLLISLVFDSQINLEITSLTQLDFYSYTVLVLIILLQLSWFLLSKKLISLALANLKKKKAFLLIAFVVAFLFGYLPPQIESINYFNQLFLFLYFTSLFYLNSKKYQTVFWQNVYFLSLFISISGLYYTTLSHHKEESVRQTGLSTYLLKNDPLLENHFLKERERLLVDSVLISQLNSSEFSRDKIIDQIEKRYFLDAKKNYEISMVLCDAESQLILMQENIETPCFPFFEDKIEQATDTISEGSLYLVDQHFRTKNYLGVIEFMHEGIKTKLFIEFLSKYQPKELGIPALLSDAKNWDLHFFSHYAYAYYFEGELFEWYGKYDYKQNLGSYGQNILDHENSFTFENYAHYVYSQDNQNVLIVSKPSVSWLEKIASLAFLFLFYSLIISILLLLIYLSQNFTSLEIGFRSRLQINMAGILLFSFFIIGLFSLYYLNYLNNEKNKSVLMEKAHSVLIELEHKFQSIEENPEDQGEYMQSLLIKFSEVFFTDINLYDIDGNLLASSRPQLFDSELLSRRMNPKAFYNLGNLKNSIFMNNERIGLQEFYSVYIPFRSVDNQTAAYLNLPYFAKQNELEEEVSGFLVAYLNIYLFLILLTLALTILVSNYLSKPLKLLKEKIQRVRLESTNEKIEWGEEDEIGSLIKEYNRMVEELEESAEKLVRSQRESAWREMAQQIAHEIKNPLTPMKLNIQYLEKAWKEGGEDFDNKLSKIAQNLTEQIDNLSDIASQFANFASSDQLKSEAIPVKLLINNSIELFSGHKHIRFETQLASEEIFIMADRNQFIRILNNLLKNAVQSISKEKPGIIKVDLFKHYNTLVLQIVDNGCGISDLEKPHIFEPHFTTKSGGMGLGLALVKKMTENANGTIRFETEENVGTSFILQFPIFDVK